MYCIAFPGGCYGNFIAWTLQWLQGNYSVDYRPFDSISHNSHNWRNQIRNTVGEAIENPFNGCILHPINESKDTIHKQFNKLLTVYDKIIAPYPALDDFLWVLNNRQTKIYAQGWIDKNQNDFDLSAWDSEDPWVMREFLSYYVHQQLIAESGYHELINIKCGSVLTVQINCLRDKFVTTIHEIAKWLKIDNIRSEQEIEVLHKDWLDNEPYLYKDRLINSYVDAIIKDIAMDMDNCSVMDQAEIQRILRTKGYEIKCQDLNIWPITTTELSTLIYEPVSK